MSTTKRVMHLLGVIALAAGLLSACNLPASTPAVSPQPTLDGTTVAQTLEADLTSVAATFTPPPGSTSPANTVTPLPTVALTTNNTTTTTQAQATLLPNTSGSTPVSTTPGPGTVTEPPCNRADFVADATYPDGSIVKPGANFVKTWRLKNSGTCTWNANYALVFFGNDALGGPAFVPATNGGIVAPGTMIDVSVTLKAPTKPGNYESDWKLSNGSGQLFGIGPDGTSPFWVKITVPGSNSNRISMQEGATSASVDGFVGNNGSVSYLVGARAGQYMMVMLNTANKPLTIQISLPNGSLLGIASSTDEWQGTLPVDGDYLLTVVNGGVATGFNFNVTIPVRVRFQAGATSAAENGQIGAQQINTYLLTALEGQTMTVTVQSDKKDVFLTIYGLQDGQPYVRSALAQATFTFKLPLTQDYVIQLVSTGNSSETYTVKFTIK